MVEQCPLKVQEAMGRNKNPTKFYLNKRKSFFSLRVIRYWKRLCKVSICGDTQNLMGHGPGQPAVGYSVVVWAEALSISLQCFCELH